MDIILKIIVIIIIIFCHVIGYYFWLRDFEKRKIYCIIGDVIIAIAS